MAENNGKNITDGLLSGLGAGGRLPHALLIEAGFAVGREAALSIAKAALCGNAGGGVPCGLCSDCRKADAGIHPDLAIIEGEKQISVETIRDLLVRTIHLRPNESEARVYIVDASNGMTLQAQNALLKSLEEPPANVFILLVASNREGLLETVLSRCAVVSLRAGESRDEQSGLARDFAVALASGDRLEAYSFAIRLPSKCRGEMGKVLCDLADLFSDGLRGIIEGNTTGLFGAFSPQRVANCAEMCDKYSKMIPRNLSPDAVAAELAVRIWEELH